MANYRIISGRIANLAHQDPEDRFEIFEAPTRWRKGRQLIRDGRGEPIFEHSTGFYIYGLATRSGHSQLGGGPVGPFGTLPKAIEFAEGELENFG